MAYEQYKQLNNYTKLTSNTLAKDIAKGQLNKIKFSPRILNEHVENSSSIQSTVTSGNIVGQIFKTSKDNITALYLTLESAAGVVLDNFESYGDSSALQSVWVKGGSNEALLETVVVEAGSKSMKLPGAILDDSWVDTISSIDYTDYTFSLKFRQDERYTKLQYEFYVGDGSNTKHFSLVMNDIDVWTYFDIPIAGMVEDGGSVNVTTITKIGFRVVNKEVGKFGYIDSLTATPPPGEIEIKLWDMGISLPATAITKISDGAQYTELGIGEVSSHRLEIKGGVQLYHIEKFYTNESLNLDHYYLLELKHIDTDVKVYGPDSSLSINHYTNGFAFTVPDEATAITKIGTYADIMFGVLSHQPVYVTKASWRFDNAPNGNAQISVYLEDGNDNILSLLVDREHKPEQEFTFDSEVRPLFLPDGGRFEYYYNDDFTDSVSSIDTEVTFMYIPPVIHG